jgi:hypothetical protein
LKNINDIQHENVRTHKEAISKLYENDNLKRFIIKCRENNINLFIGGSTGLHAVYSKCNFTPNDVDVYLKHCSREQLIRIENVIREVFPKDNVLVIRCPIVVTWVVYDINQQILFQIQVNILDITRYSIIYFMKDN